MFKNLDPLLHAQLRLAVMSILIGLESADFTFLKEKTGATQGNLSVQIRKLSEAGYIEVKKSFRGNYPLTTCNITPKGIRAFEVYVDAIKGYLDQPASDASPS
jgi:DNA-binding transcriptional ArsR family regulator